MHRNGNISGNFQKYKKDNKYRKMQKKSEKIKQKMQKRTE